jgi:hypothetical protein
MTFPRVAWCGVAVIALHNAEEALTIPTWLPPRLAELEAPRSAGAYSILVL